MMVNKIMLSILLTLLLCTGCGGGGGGGSDESTPTQDVATVTPPAPTTLGDIVPDVCSTTDEVLIEGTYDFTYIDVDQDPDAPNTGTVTITEDCRVNLLIHANPDKLIPGSLTIGDFSIEEQIFLSTNIALWQFTSRPAINQSPAANFHNRVLDGNQMPVTLNLGGVFIVEEDVDIGTAITRSFEELFALETLREILQIPTTVTLTSFEQRDTRKVQLSEFLLTPWTWINGFIVIPNFSGPRPFPSEEGFVPEFDMDRNLFRATFTVAGDRCTITHTLTLHFNPTNAFDVDGNLVGDICDFATSGYRGTMFFWDAEEGPRATAYVEYADRGVSRTMDFVAGPAENDPTPTPNDPTPTAAR